LISNISVGFYRIKNEQMQSSQSSTMSVFVLEFD